jgi:hypothetical protein
MVGADLDAHLAARMASSPEASLDKAKQKEAVGKESKKTAPTRLR